MSKQKYNINKDNLIKDFLNGLTIEELVEKYNYPRRYVLINEIQSYIGSEQTIFRCPKSKIPIYYFLGGIKFSRKLYEIIYKDSTIWLARKRKRLEYICLGHDNTEITELIKTFQYCNA